MTSLAAFPRQSPAHAGFARPRLYLGISGVGTAVLGATVLLTTGIAGRLLSTSNQQPLLLALSSLGAVFVVIMFELLLFDMVGGALLVRQKRPFGEWLARWLRGTGVQLNAMINALSFSQDDLRRRKANTLSSALFTSIH